MKIIIIGGGIAGLTTATALRRKGFEAEVYEAAPQIKALGAGLVLAANAVKGLTKAGVADRILPAGRQLKSLRILDSKGRTISHIDSEKLSARYGVDNFAIHRVALHRILIDQLPAASLHPGKKAVSCSESNNSVSVRFQDGSEASADLLIVADGIHSAIRSQLVPGSAPRYAGYTCWRGVVDDPGLNLQDSSETWGVNGRIGIVPLADHKIYWFACVNAPQADETMRAYTVNDLLRRFGSYHHPIPEVLQATRPDQLLWNDIVDLAPIGQYAFGRTVLIGDAAHATTPNMGQGACQAIEDAVVLADELADSPTRIEAALRRFEQRRLPRARFVVNTSWQIGKVAQWTNPLLAGLRNAAFRMIPESVNERQTAFLYNVDF